MHPTKRRRATTTIKKKKSWVHTPQAKHPAAALTAEQAVDQYAKLVKKWAWRARRRLPAGTVYTLADLIQEGQARVVYSLARYKAGRGTAFSTYLTIALCNHYNHLVRHELLRADIRVDPRAHRSDARESRTLPQLDTPFYYPEADARLTGPPPQEQWLMELDILERGVFPFPVPRAGRALTIGLRRYAPIAV